MSAAAVSFIKKCWPQSIAGALMAAPIYLDLSHSAAAWIFYSLGAFGSVGLLFEIWTEVREPRPAGLRRRYLAWAAIAFGALVLTVCGWLFWPTSFHHEQSQPVPKSQLLSRMDRYIFACDVPPPDEKMAAKFPQAKEEMKRNFEILGDATGMSLTVTDIRGGLRLDAEANTEEAKRRLFTAGTGGLSKLAIEVRRYGQQEIVTVAADMPDYFRLFSLMTPEPSSQDTVSIQRKIEHFVGVAEGKCKLL